MTLMLIYPMTEDLRQAMCEQLNENEAAMNLAEQMWAAVDAEADDVALAMAKVARIAKKHDDRKHQDSLDNACTAGDCVTYQRGKAAQNHSPPNQPGGLPRCGERGGQ